MTAAKTEEQNRLDLVTGRLLEALTGLDSRLARHERDIREEKAYFWESKAEMDGAEKAFTRQSIDQGVTTGEAVVRRRNRLRKLLLSPYFGRFDFARNDGGTPESIYVGVHDFTDERSRKTLVHDWRAPVSTVFYEHEIGPARYQAPSGVVEGRVLLKRQFRIRDGRMEFMLDTAVNIVDDVLQEELSRASEDGMKQIVATIQREQNAIIRNDQAGELIIQGVAGSGKTSIALHRIAYLLYRFKEDLTSKDILIISPNRVFGDYISNVLPELGEESVSEINMETLAAELLDFKFRFQTFYEQSALLLESDDAAIRRRIEAKSSPDFLETLNQYIEHLEETAFTPEDLSVAGHKTPGGFLATVFWRHRGAPPAERIRHVADAVERRVGIRFNYDLTAADKAEVRKKVRKMQRRLTLRAAYKGLFAWMGEPKLFKPLKDGKLEYADVFPLIYLKLRLEGVDSIHKRIKHLLIDEMQDYTPVQYAVIAKLFRCNKTILGDAKQSVNPYSSSTGEQILSVLRQASYVKLCKSYRSSYQICQFTQRIAPDPDLVAMERHGEEPRIVACRDAGEEAALISRLVGELSDLGHHTLGVICKTQLQAERLHAAITALGCEAHLLSGKAPPSRGASPSARRTWRRAWSSTRSSSRRRPPGTTAPRWIGTRSMSPVRAMHKLTLTFAGELTRLIEDRDNEATGTREALRRREALRGA